MPLTLTLDHINGNNKDNRLENLRWICPNCDRQTDTFAGKNIKKLSKDKNKEITLKIKPLKVKSKCPPKKELLKIIENNNGNFTEVGKIFEVSTSSVRRWCDKYKISRHSKDYKNYKDYKQRKERTPPKPVRQIELHTGNVVAIFNSISEAQRITKIDHISSVCNGTRKTAGGYIWEFIN